MNTATGPLALLAEDEPVLARTLSRLLAQAWPELRLAGVAEDGMSAVELERLNDALARGFASISAGRFRLAADVVADLRER